MKIFDRNLQEQKAQTLSVDKLSIRYKLGRLSIYEKMVLLGIERFMEDEKSCISLEDLQLLDDL